MKFKVKVETYAVIEADSHHEAERELEARREKIVIDIPKVERDLEHDLLLNAEVMSVDFEDMTETS
jgi:hypothetical protein